MYRLSLWKSKHMESFKAKDGLDCDAVVMHCPVCACSKEVHCTQEYLKLSETVLFAASFFPTGQKCLFETRVSNSIHDVMPELSYLLGCWGSSWPCDKLFVKMGIASWKGKYLSKFGLLFFEECLCKSENWIDAKAPSFEACMCLGKKEENKVQLCLFLLRRDDE